MDGSKTTNDAWDMPHFEMHPWRDWAKQSKLFEG
jgi:peptidoglycan L-alanyl-D-glutamate endopeptidase CwlK